MLPSQSPLPSRTELLEGARELLRRSAEATEPCEAIRCVLAICHTAGSKELPDTLRCRAHLAAGSLLHEHTEEPAQAVQHIRIALGLCSKLTHSSSDCLLKTVCGAIRVAQSLLRSGALSEARKLLSTIQGVLQQQTDGTRGSANDSKAPPPLPPQMLEAVQWLKAHAGVLHVGLSVREGQLMAAERKAQGLIDVVHALPGTHGLSTCPSREELLRVLRLHLAIILVRQGELTQGASKLDELLVDLKHAVAGDESDGRRATLAVEAGLLRASVHVARLEFDAVLALAPQLQEALCRPREHTSDGRAADRLPSGTSAWLLLVAHAALRVGDGHGAAKLLKRAAEAEATRGCAPGAVSQWCELMLVLLQPLSP
mgnify:CR=1 FL=1